MRTINVLATQRISADDRAKIEASDPAIRLIDAGGWFDGEIRETWTAFAAARYLPPGATGSGSREERDRLLAEAEVIIGGWPFPVDLRARAPRLKWFHQRQAGASNLLGSDLWGSDIVVTTSRGVANSLPIAEYAIAGILHFAMGFNRAVIDRRSRCVRSSGLSAAPRTGQDRLRGRRRRDRERSRPAVRRARHAGRWHPPAAAAGRAAAARL
jgi:hypothetical protein